MVKLSRIVKKIVSNNDHIESKKKEVIPVNESLASKGKPQPTIDFSNLPSFESIKMAKECENDYISNKRYKKLLKVNKKKLFKIKPNKLESKKYKSKLFDRNKINDSKSHEQSTVKFVIPDKVEDEPKEEKPSSAKNKQKVKVIKTGQMLSRGKRKRELKKESWRRKNEFKNEAKKIIEQFQKEDKHGKALGNLSGMKGQLEMMEQAIRSRLELKNKSVKMRSKLDPKTILKSRKMFNIATSNL